MMGKLKEFVSNFSLSSNEKVIKDFLGFTSIDDLCNNMNILDELVYIYR